MTYVSVKPSPIARSSALAFALILIGTAAIGLGLGFLVAPVLTVILTIAGASTDSASSIGALCVWLGLFGVPALAIRMRKREKSRLRRQAASKVVQQVSAEDPQSLGLANTTA